MVRTAQRTRWSLAVACLLALLQFQPARAQGTAADVYLSPLPGSQSNPPGTTIAVRFGDRLDAHSLKAGVFAATGSLSGDHPGKIVLAGDGETAIFKPDRPFTPGEAVQVRIGPGIAAISGVRYPQLADQFRVASAADLALAAAQRKAAFSPEAAPEASTKSAMAVKSYLTAPQNLPQITLNVPANGAAPGDIFASDFLPSAYGGAPDPGAYLMILDNQGQPVYYQPVPATTLAVDFKVLPDGRLAFWEAGAYHILDHSYREVQTINPGNGYVGIDPHELLELPGGDFLFLIDDYRTIDMSQVVSGGNPNAIVVGIVIQELDAGGNVVFQWNSFDHNHIPITDSNQDLTAATIDYIHTNSVALDRDGNLLISSRHLSEITKIDRQTGDILWRMGGKANQFTFDTAPGINDDPHFYYQHDARYLANGDITVFDNHYLQNPATSRALEYTLDEAAKKATLIWEYSDSPPVDSAFMGNAQRLANGDTLIGWGGVSSPAITEVRSDGSKALELSLPAGYTSYRALRFAWQGFPTWAPVLAARENAGAVHLAFSWNGATEIARYKIYGGNAAGPPPSVLIDAQPKTGFETSVDLVGIQTYYCFYRVMPIDLGGQPTQWSNVVQNPACSFNYLPVISK